MALSLSKIEAGADAVARRAADGKPPVRVDLPPGLSNLKTVTDLSACISPLLEALAWRGDWRHVAEAIPHFIDSLDITSFRNVMANLHYESRPLRINMKRVDPRNMPCLFLPDKGDALILLGLEKGGVRVFDGGNAQYNVIPPRGETGTAYFFNRVEEEEIAHQTKAGWFKTINDRFIPLVYQALGISLILNILALATPLFVMAVYDKVVNTGSLTTLAYFAIGVCIALACDVILRGIRSRILAFVGARLDTLVGNAVFEKILFLPPAFTERAGLGAQVARVKDFENIREFFTGPMSLVFFELPFVVIFVTVIGAMGGIVLALVPLTMIVLYVIMGALMAPFIRQAVAKGARAGTKKQEFVVEALNNMRAIKYCGAERRWLDRYRELSAKASLAGYKTAQLSAITSSMSHIFMVGSGVATVAVGVFRVINGDMSVGGLVASMILVWRVLAPLQSGFMALTRMTQVRSSINQINNLMNIKGERQPGMIVRTMRRLEGRVTFSRVSLRYTPDSDPALVGANFDVKPGQIVAVVGGNGSGKSTILKLLIGLYQPQAGGIRVDDMDIRQLDPIELRHAIAYVPQVPQFYYGTIAQNLRLANPTATEEDLHWAADQAGCLQDVLDLSQGSGKWQKTGFDVRIGDAGSGQLPASLLQRLNLARGFIKRASIMLFDEPGNGLDFQSDKLFMKRVDEMRGKVTCFIVTHRPSHLRTADLIVWLDSGHIRAFGPAEKVLEQMPKDFV